MRTLSRTVTLAIFCFSIANLSQRTRSQEDELEVQELPEDFVFPPFTCDQQGQFPYSVSIRDGTSDREHLCGGIVIASNAVLTAAHCLDRRSSNRATITPDIHVGGQNTDDPVEIRQTILAIPHPGWTGNTEDGDDLVVIKLNEETCARPIHQLGIEDADNRNDILFLGFGRTSIGGRFSFTLNGAFMNTFNSTHCTERYNIEPQLGPDKLCARTQTTVGICTGDEGGPLIYQPTLRFYRDVVIGIASFSTAPCSDTEGASVFMNIREYRDWINETLESERFLNA